MHALPDFSKFRLLVAGDGEALRFGDAWHGIAGSGERPAACGRADHVTPAVDRK